MSKRQATITKKLSSGEKEKEMLSWCFFSHVINLLKLVIETMQQKY